MVLTTDDLEGVAEILLGRAQRYLEAFPDEVDKWAEKFDEI